MQSETEEERLCRFRYAGGGHGGAPPIRLEDKQPWRLGDPCHWMEKSRFMRTKTKAVRIAVVIQIITSILYMQFRARKTIGLYESSRHPAVLTYQIIFFVCEVFTVFSLFFRLVEIWNVSFRNCVDFNKIPNDLIAPHFKHSKSARVRPQHCNKPSVDVFIPCYNEHAELVLEAVLAAVAIDYPPELLKVFLCDDGQDPAKRQMISQLRRQHRNVHYVIRPEHTHAKAGNLNYAMRRTSSHLAVTLDADFIVRPWFLNRMLSYFFVWNSTLGMYEFNTNLAAVQSPQHFRNLSPYDSDPLDQRAHFFNDMILTGKDWFNASTVIGTNNVLNREALVAADFYPYHSITEDTGLSMKFHSLGYRTYYTRESAATGLATVSLWSHLRQRSRWLKGDWQIFFSRQGPLTMPNINIFQRILYLNMCFSRFVSVIFLFFDVGAVLVLVFGISPLDIEDALEFVIYFTVYILVGTMQRMVMNSGKMGYGKSQSGTIAFEAIFRYTTCKSILLALFAGNNLKFKVTEKPQSTSRRPRSGAKEGVRSGEEGERDDGDGLDADVEIGERVHVSSRSGATSMTLGAVSVATSGTHAPLAVVDGATVEAEGVGSNALVDLSCSRNVITRPPRVVSGGMHGSSADGRSATSTGDGYEDEEEDESLSDDESDYGRSLKKGKFRMRSVEERAQHRIDVRKNLKRIWFNILTAIVLLFALGYGIARPQVRQISSEVVVENGVRGRMVRSDLLPMALAFGFALVNVLPHLLAVYLCFIPYLSGWVMTDLVHGRCDQYAIHPKSGRLFVPWSFISLLSLVRGVFLFGSLIVVMISLQGDYRGTFVPLSES